MGKNGECYTLLSSEESLPAASARRGTFTFTWNQRECTGTALHRAVLDEDVDEAANLLLKDGTNQVSERFYYDSSYKGVAQSGSGEAIHLAATQGHEVMVNFLLENKAALGSKVTRGSHDHYDVLHAAVFGSGRGGSGDLLRSLLDRRASLNRNANNHSPLHVAFLTGRPELIKILRHEALQRGESMGEDLDPTMDRGQDVTPLELGIANGKMSATQLAEVAPLTPSSLHIFSQAEPNCIIPFIKRCLEEEIPAHRLASYISFQDLTEVLRENPSAAAALLDVLAQAPIADSPAWHPLPTRISYAPQTWVDRLRCWHVFNNDTSVLTFYSPDCHWSYDSTAHQAPAWHTAITSLVPSSMHKKDKSEGRLTRRRKLVRDTDVRVCHVPNLACPEVLAALGLCRSREDLDIFSKPVVKGLISHVWLNGACRVDLWQGLLSIYCLGVVLVEQVLTLPGMYDEVHARKLRAGGHRSATHHADSSTRSTSSGMMDLGPEGWDPVPVSMNLIAVRGIVTLGVEMLTFVGYVKMYGAREYAAAAREYAAAAREYANAGTALALVQALCQISVLLDPHCIRLRTVVIFLCWGSVLRTVTPSEKIASELLPLTQCAFGLIPCGLLALIFFLASFHALFNLKRAENIGDLGNLFLETFSMLFTGALPEEADIDVCLLMFTYTVVLVFTVFFLNIFIGVIIEQYTFWKSSVELSYQQVLCQHCLNYLLTLRMIPSNLFSRRVAWYAILFSISALVVIQAWGLWYGDLIRGSRFIFLMCLVIITLSLFQDPDPGLKSTTDKPHYLWVLTPVATVPEVPEELQELHQNVREILQTVQGGGMTPTQKCRKMTEGQRSRTEVLVSNDRLSWNTNDDE